MEEEKRDKAVPGHHEELTELLDNVCLSRPHESEEMLRPLGLASSV